VRSSKKQDKYAHKAKVQTTINGQVFTADADSLWACEMFPELGSPAEGFRFKQWSEARLKDAPTVWE
jgi:hypothetical protein